MKLYLCGPITGHSASDIKGWRDAVRSALDSRVEIIDPASAPYDASLDHLEKETSSEALERLAHGRFINQRNKALISGSDLVLANLLGSGDRISIGSIGELFWADAFGKPVILIREQTGNPHDHAMLNALAATICDSLEDGLNKAEEMLGLSAPILRVARG